MRIAVIGGGISGLASALILKSKHEVHLFEADSRLGGHANTVFVKDSEGQQVALDSGFLVYNTLTYPHFTRFLDYLRVKSVESDMSLSIQAPNGLEWGGADLRTVFAQKRNGLRPAFLNMLFDILHFNRNAESNLELSRKNRWTLEELVKFRKYSEAFQTLYLLPMTGAIWSMSYSKALQFPAETFLTFCINHHLLQVNHRPIWRTVDGGSINYVQKVREQLKNVHLSTPIDNIFERDGKVILSYTGIESEFDKVIIATHAPTAHKLLQTGFPDLAQELSHLRVTSNKVEIHQDSSIMPKRKICWSAWNVRAQKAAQDDNEICLTYYINKLQPFVSKNDHFITLNANKALDHVERTLVYDHPQFDFGAIELQKKLPQLQGRHNIYLAGAWTRYGFHEDGILSAVQVAEKIGVKAPWIHEPAVEMEVPELEVRPQTALSV